MFRMPSAIFKRKMPKTFRRKKGNQRSASAQASPALGSTVYGRMDDTALPPPITSNAIIPDCTDTLQVKKDAMDAEERFACANDNRRTSDIMMNHDFPSNTPPLLRPSPSVGDEEIPRRASLMGIPVELRMMIFESVFPPSDAKGTAETTLYCGPTLRVLGPSNSQLCRVNRQIYEETRGLLYGQTLVFLSRDALTKFSSTRNCQQMSQFRSICMKPRVTDWSGAIKTLVLPPGASLTVHWPITRELWQALTANITLDYRQVTVLSGNKEMRVVFEPVTNVVAKRPTFDSLQRAFASASS